MNEASPSTCPIDYEWIPVEIDKGTPLHYPRVDSKFFREHYSHAGVYRWGIYKRDSLIKAYVGEGWNLAKRIPPYLKPGPSQKTNIRVHEELESAVAAGYRVRLEILTIRRPIRINNVTITDSDLQNPHVRLMMENFVLADHEKVNCEILNLKQNPIERRKRKSAALRSKAGF
jgi:hypothetical protein